MNKLWNPFKLGLLGTCLIVAITGCGQTGPSAGKSNNGTASNGGVNVGVSSSISSSAISSISSSSVENTSADIGAMMESVDVVEGSLIIAADYTVVEEGSDPTVSLKYTLNKPLAADAAITAVYDADRSTCTKNRMAPPKDILSVKKDVTTLTIIATVFRNNNPEDDCDTIFNLSVNYGDHTDIIKANGRVHIKDDDVLHDSVDSELYNQGDFVKGNLNGDIKYDGTIYTVTQVSGPKAEFKVYKDSLHMIMPEFTASGVTPIVVSVTPSNKKYNTANYTMNVHGSGTPSTEFENVTQGEGDQDQSNVEFLTGVKGIGYVRDYITPDDLLSLKWVLETKSPQNTVEYLGTSLTHHGGRSTNISDADYPVMNKLLTLDADGRTLRLRPEALPTLKKYLDDSTVFTLHAGLKIHATSSINEEEKDEKGNFVYELAEVFLRMRPAPHQLTVHLKGIDASQLAKADLRLVVREQDNSTYSNVRVVPVKDIDTTFKNLYQGSYQIRLIDFEKGELDVGFEIIEPKNLAVTYTLDASKAVIENVVSKGVTQLKKTNAAMDLQGQQTIGLKNQKPDVDTDCESNMDTYLVRTAAQDTEVSCTHTFTTQELKGDTPKQSRQLVIKVTSLEFPSFTDKNTKYTDSWSWSLTSSIKNLESMTKFQSDTVEKSNKDRRTFVSVSPCFTLDENATDTLTFTAKVKNIGDSSNDTWVSSEVKNCAELYKIDNPKLTNREPGNIFLFANKNPKLNNEQALISLPYGLTETSSVYTSANNAFGFTLNILPLSDNAGVAKAIALDALEMGLNVGNEHGQDEESLALGSIKVSDAKPKISVTDLTELKNGKSIVIGKTITVTNYRLPINYQGHVIPYPATNRTVSLMVAANINPDTPNSYITGVSALRLIDIKEKTEVNLDTANLRPLLRIEALKDLLPRDSTRFDWIASNQRFGQGVNDDSKGGDTWILPSVWKNTFAQAHTTLMSDCPTDVINLPALIDLSPLTICMPGLKENSTNTSYPDYVDNLSLNDASAVHVRCHIEGAKCKSILQHSGHQLGTSLDLSYLDSNGQPGSKFPKYYYDLWAAAAKSPLNQNAVNNLKSWVKINRAYIQSIIKDQRGSPTDYSLPTTTKVRKVYLGKGDSSNEPALPQGTPSIFKILTVGTLPPIANDTSLGVWNPYSWIKDNNNAYIVQEMTPHDNHFHVEFEPSEPGDF